MNYFQRYLVEEFAEDYQNGQISHSRALKLIAGVTRDVTLASSILANHSPDEQNNPNSYNIFPAAPRMAASSGSPSPGDNEPTEQFKEGNTDVRAGSIRFPSNGDKLLGYLAIPLEENGPWPVILVCHENRGLTDHIKDVTRRLARAGYVALAIDLLSRLGGTHQHDRDEVPGLLGNIPPEQFVSDFYAGWRFLEDRAFAITERVGMVGFCFGGGITWLMSTRMPELKAAVPYYGPHPPIEDVPKIRAAVQAIYGELDQRINQGIPAIEAAMLEHHKIFKKLVYPNAGHAFNNDTTDRYAPVAARDAWQQTLDWFGKWV